eukprot:6187498-Pleurochrysis_carterae.AAC.2
MERAVHHRIRHTWFVDLSELHDYYFAHESIHAAAQPRLPLQCVLPNPCARSLFQTRIGLSGSHCVLPASACVDRAFKVLFGIRQQLTTHSRSFSNGTSISNAIRSLPGHIPRAALLCVQLLQDGEIRVDMGQPILQGCAEPASKLRAHPRREIEGGVRLHKGWEAFVCLFVWSVRVLDWVWILVWGRVCARAEGMGLATQSVGATLLTELCREMAVQRHLVCSCNGASRHAGASRGRSVSEGQSLWSHRTAAMLGARLRPRSHSRRARVC